MHFPFRALMIRGKSDNDKGCIGDYTSRVCGGDFMFSMGPMRNESPKITIVSIPVIHLVRDRRQGRVYGTCS